MTYLALISLVKSILSVLDNHFSGVLAPLYLFDFFILFVLIVIFT